MDSVKYTLIGGPTFLLEIAGLRIVVDPTFDPPQTYTGYGIGRANAFVKTTAPALSVEEVLPVDVVLITHDQHIDHLDYAGRGLLPHASAVFTTRDGAERLGQGSIGLGEFESIEVSAPTGETLKVMGVRAQHGPDPLWRGAGACNGFVLSGEGLPTVYISGDNYALEVAQEIADQIAPVDVAILFGGGARFDEIANGALITMPNADSVQVAKAMSAAAVVVAHTEGWAHFHEDAAAMVDAFRSEGLEDIVHTCEPGDTVVIGPRTSNAPASAL